MARSIRIRTRLRVALFILGTSSLGVVLSALTSVWPLVTAFSVLAILGAAGALVLACENDDAQMEEWEIEEDSRGGR